jgi:bifunctional NMN adenylyltransferase/nudix hydrolase
MKKYRLTVVIGRFQPFHIIHKQIVEKALELGDKTLVILGSAKKAPNVKNPFTPALREQMIRACFDDEQNARLVFKPLRDYPYNENNWISEVQNIVRNEQEALLDQSGEEFEPVRHNILLGQIKTALVGYYKDSSSYYLKVFPQWQFEELYTDTKISRTLNATDIRSLLFDDANKGWSELVPSPVVKVLNEFKQTETYEKLKKEHEYIITYRANTKFVGASFSPTFVTTDAVVVARGHILLVRRGFQPGLGQLALPGGFVAPNMRLKDNCVKELKEETSINMDSSMLRRAIKASEVFDDCERSQRGRTITHAFYLELFPRLEDGLPLVKGGDDAARAFWLPISALGDVEDELFEDHYDIIRYFLDTPLNREQ